VLHICQSVGPSVRADDVHSTALSEMPVANYVYDQNFIMANGGNRAIDL